MELFIKQPEFEKVARRILDQDATKWTKQILDEFFTEFPYFMSQNVNLQFKRKDENKGAAVATIEVGDISVPVIIKEFGLAPFDVLYYKGVTLPLTQETLGALTNSKSAFSRVVKPDMDDNQLDLLFERTLVDLQPTGQFGKHASVSVIDRISDTITAEHKKELLEKLSSDESIRAGFEINDTVSVLEKIAQVIPKPKVRFYDSLSKILPRDIQYLEKIGRFSYKLTLGNSSIYDPIEIDLTERQATKVKSVIAVGTDIEKKAVFSSTRGAAFKLEGRTDKLVVMNIDGMRKHAYIQDVEASDPEYCDKLFGGEMPQVGDYGIWSNDGKASVPFEIDSIAKEGSVYTIRANTGDKKMTYIPLRSVSEVTPHETIKSACYIPTTFKFVKVGDMADITTKSPKEAKVANYYTRDDVDLYNLSGPVFEKLARFCGRVDNLSKARASFLALQCRASEGAIAKLATAPTNVRVPFECELMTPQSIDKASELLEREYGEYAKNIKNLATDLVKEAATLADKQSVDAILALNMITKENVLEFVNQLPLYEQVLSDLAKLLLTVRLGLSTIPELALSRAMKGLSQVVEILRGMNNLDKVQS